MPSNKNRLYVALYPSGIGNNPERKYHWAFLIGPKNEPTGPTPGLRCHVKNPSILWEYEETELGNVKSTIPLLARIVIAKIEDEQRLRALLRRLEVRQGDPDWTCRTWIQDAVEAIRLDGKCVGTAVLNWEAIEDKARNYVAKKTALGRYEGDQDMEAPKPTYNMLKRRETVE